jgi:hypothetical protein
MNKLQVKPTQMLNSDNSVPPGKKQQSGGKMVAKTVFPG